MRFLFRKTLGKLVVALATALPAAIAATDGAANGSDIVASDLPLSIRGVITSSNPENSVALLQDKKYGKLVAVRPGYLLYKTSKVVSIPSVKTIILKRKDRFEFLGDKPLNFDPTVAP